MGKNETPFLKNVDKLNQISEGTDATGELVNC